MANNKPNKSNAAKPVANKQAGKGQNNKALAANSNRLNNQNQKQNRRANH